MRGLGQAELEKLEGLVVKWRATVQTLALDLQTQAEAAGTPVTVAELLKAFQVDPALVQFKPEADAF